MERRKFLIAAGSLAAGSAAAVGTGAVTSVTANRSITVASTDDATAMIGITGTGSDNSQSFFTTEGGKAVLNFQENVDASGFNQGVSYVDNLFDLTNNSNQGQYVWIVEDGINGGDKAVGFYVGTGPSDGSPPDYQMSVGSNNIGPRDLQPFKPYDNTVVPSEGTHAVPLSVGETETIGMAVDTRQLGSGNPNPGELLSKITIHSVSDPNDLPARNGGSPTLDPT